MAAAISGAKNRPGADFTGFAHSGHRTRRQHFGGRTRRQGHFGYRRGFAQPRGISRRAPPVGAGRLSA